MSMLPRRQHSVCFSFFLILTVFFTFCLSGCGKKETPIIYFYCCELYWEAMWEETQLFKGLYNVDVVMIPILPYPTKEKQVEETEPLKKTSTEEETTTLRRIPAPWRSRPKVRRFLSRDQLVLDHRLSGLISSLADNQQYGDLYLSDSFEQLEELRNLSLASHEYPFCYLTMVLLVAAGNPHDIDSTDSVLDKKLRLGIASPSCSGMGSTAWKIISKTETAMSVRESAQERLQESIFVYDHYPELLAALERGELDAVLAWDVLVRQAEEFASVVHLRTEHPSDHSDFEQVDKEHHVIRQALISLRISNEEGYGRRFADFLISTQGQAVLKKHGFTPKPL